MDYFDALLTGGTNDPERMKETARQLRRQQAYGTLGALTGDPVLSQFGTGMVERAGERASVLQKARQAGTTARALGGCSYEQGGVIKEIPGCQEARREGFQNKLLLQALKSQGKETEDYRPLSTSLENRAQAQAANLENLKMLQSSFVAEYAQPLREQLGDLGAGAGPLHNLPLWAARTFGAGTEQAKNAEEWYGSWRRFMTLPVRNELFGATLTPSEQKAWDQALEIGPGMSEEQITSRIRTLIEEAERSAKRRARTMLSERYRPQTVKALYGDALGDDFFVAYGEKGSGNRKWTSADEVKAAFENGEIDTIEEAADILRNEFGME